MPPPMWMLVRAALAAFGSKMRPGQRDAAADELPDGCFARQLYQAAFRGSFAEKLLPGSLDGQAMEAHLVALRCSRTRFAWPKHRLHTHTHKPPLTNCGCAHQKAPHQSISLLFNNHKTFFKLFKAINYVSKCHSGECGNAEHCQLASQANNLD